MFYSSMIKNDSRPKKQTARKIPYIDTSSSQNVMSVKVIRYSEEDCPSCEKTKKAWKLFKEEHPDWDCVDCLEGQCKVPDEIVGFPQIAVEVGEKRKVLIAGWDKAEIIEEVKKLQKG